MPSQYPYIYHNYQGDGDHYSSEMGLSKGKREAIEVVRQAFQRGRQNMIEKGFIQRQMEAFHYSRFKLPRFVVFSEDDLSDDYSEDEDSLKPYEKVHEMDADELCKRMCSKDQTLIMDYITEKHSAAMSSYLDAQKYRGSSYASFEPTPVVDTSEENMKRAALLAQKKFFEETYISSLNQAQQTGQSPELLAIQTMNSILSTDDGLDMYEGIVDEQVRFVNARLTSQARVKAKNAQNAVNDAVSESNWDTAEMQQVSNSFWYDLGVLRTPEMIEKKTTEVNKDGILEEEIKKVWKHDAIHPLNYFCAPNRTFTDYGDYEGDIVKLTSMELEMLKELDGADIPAINHVLKNAHIYTTLNGFSDSDYIGDEDHSQWTQLDRVSIVRINIRLSPKICRALFPNNKKIKGNYGREVEIWCTHDKILRAVFEPYYVNYRPYKLNAFKITDYSDIFSARGLYSLLKTPQEMVLNSLVQWKHSLKYIQKAIIEINSDKLHDKDPEVIDGYLSADLAVVPTKGQGTTGQYGGNDRAIFINQLPDKTSTFIASYREAVSLMDGVSFPSFATGAPDIPSSVRSTGSLAILQTNANKNMQKFFLQQEEMVQVPSFKYLWQYLCLKNKDRSITLDSKIVASSYSGFLQKDQKKTDIQQAFQSMSSIISAKFQYDQMGLDSRWIDGIIMQLAEESGIDTTKLPIAQIQGGIMENSSPDMVAEPLEGLTPVNNVPQDINQVI